MDFQKHGFWIVLGVVLVLELGFLFLFVLPADSKVSKAEGLIKRHTQKLSSLAGESEIPNKNDIGNAQKARSDAAKGLLRGVLHMAAADELQLERRVAGIETPADIGPHFQEKQRRLEQQLREGQGVFSGLRLKDSEDPSGGDVRAKLIWPSRPQDTEEVPYFYRKWWVMKMLLEQVLAPVSKAVVAASPDKKPWELNEISWGDDEEGEKGGYVNQYLHVRVVLKVRLTDLHKLFLALVNTPFYVLPVGLVVKQAEPDPRVIRINVAFGKPDPSKEEQKRRASLQRPLVEVVLKAKVADLDRGKLLDIARRFLKPLGSRQALESYLEDLKEDKEFLKGFSDKDKFLDTMKAELTKKS